MTRYLLLFDSYGRVLWGALSDERTGLCFVHAAGPCQCSLSRVRVPWDWRPYFTVLDLKFPFSSPPTSRRITVEIFYPASTRVKKFWKIAYVLLIRHGPHRKRHFQQFFFAGGGGGLPSCNLTNIEDTQAYTQTQASKNSVVACVHSRGNVFTEPLRSNERRKTLYEPLSSNDRRDMHTYRHTD
jgi:hypothetical protein